MRPLIARQLPPMAAIMQAVGRLAPGQPLRLLAPFEPAPLYQFLGARGFTHEATQRADGVWVVIFRPADSAAPPSE